MRSYDAATLAALNSRNVASYPGLWLIARNRSTNAQEALGLWAGDDTRSITIDGVPRTYYAAGSLLGFGPLVSEVGFQVRYLSVSLSPIAAAVREAALTHDLRGAPAEVHRFFLDLDTREVIGTPAREFKGVVAEFPMPVAAPGGESRAEMRLASNARSLTRRLSIKKSDASQTRRSGDRGRRWGDVSGAVEVFWGE